MLITNKDVFEFTGKDLALELRDKDSKKSERFIARAESLVRDYIEEHFKAVDGNRDAVLKIAVLHQIDYMLLHGEVDIYNPDNVPLLAPRAYSVLRNNGLANLRGM